MRMGITIRFSINLFLLLFCQELEIPNSSFQFIELETALEVF